MTWWDSYETLSRLQTALTIFVTVLSVLILTIKIRADQLKKQTDTRRAIERVQLDKELKDQTAAALKATAALEARTRSRSISESQERELLALLAPAPKGNVTITVTESDSEAVAFAGHISRVLQNAGFSVDTQSVMMMSGPRGAPVGLIFSIRDVAAVPPHAQAIGDAFHTVGIPFEAGTDPNTAEGVLSITVGAKLITP